MTLTQYALIALAVFVILIIIFSLIKGVIKMIMLSLTVVLSIACWLFLQRNGETLLSFVISEPKSWMVQAISYIAALLVFLILFHGLRWFSQLFSWRRNGATSGGIITTILMSILMLWMGYISFSYASNLALVSYYREMAQCHSHGQAAPEIPSIVTAKKRMLDNDALSWLRKIDPLDNAARTTLASLIAYGCSLPEAQRTYFYASRLENCGISYPSRFNKLFSDEGLRQIVEQENFASLLENDLLETFLQAGNSQQYLEENFQQNNKRKQ
ncbi:MAG: hypothetical protein R3Y56_07170 [Akkermansia sp.]